MIGTLPAYEWPKRSHAFVLPVVSPDNFADAFKLCYYWASCIDAVVHDA